MIKLQQLLNNIKNTQKKQEAITEFIYCLDHDKYYTIARADIMTNQAENSTVFRDLHKKCKTLNSDGCEYSDFGGAFTILQYLVDYENTSQKKSKERITIADEWLKYTTEHYGDNGCELNNSLYWEADYCILCTEWENLIRNTKNTNTVKKE